jgi:hypothetical protein
MSTVVLMLPLPPALSQAVVTLPPLPALLTAQLQLPRVSPEGAVSVMLALLTSAGPLLVTTRV